MCESRAHNLLETKDRVCINDKYTNTNQDSSIQTSRDWVTRLNTPPEARHPQNKRKIILIVIADITVNGSEFNGNIFIGSKNTRYTIDFSVCLVVCRKCKNERIIRCKVHEFVLRKNSRCKSNGVNVIGCEECLSNIIDSAVKCA